MSNLTTGQQSMALAKQIFGNGKLKNAKARIDSNWEREGHYLERIDNVKITQNRKKQTGVVIEKTIIHVYDDKDGAGHRLGESVSHSMWDHHDSFLGNVKAFLAGTMGLDVNAVEDDHIFQVIGDDQPLAGTIVECFNREIMTRSDKPFTVINYKREVPAVEVKKTLTPDAIKNFFPDGKLDKAIEFEAALAEQLAAQAVGVEDEDLPL